MANRDFYNDDDFYGDEDQNSTMNLINSRDWPAEAQTVKDTEDYIEQFVAQVNKLRREIADCNRNGKDAEELIHELAKAEENLDKWIDIRIQYRKLNNEPLPY